MKSHRGRPTDLVLNRSWSAMRDVRFVELRYCAVTVAVSLNPIALAHLKFWRSRADRSCGDCPLTTRRTSGEWLPGWACRVAPSRGRARTDRTARPCVG